jgi:hypothetical protein
MKSQFFICAYVVLNSRSTKRLVQNATRVAKAKKANARTPFRYEQLSLQSCVHVINTLCRAVGTDNGAEGDHAEDDPDQFVVVDPYMGTGSMLVAAVACGLPTIGLDIDPLSEVSILSSFPLIVTCTCANNVQATHARLSRREHCTLC